MVITAIGYLLLALSVLAVLGFCWLTASCAGPASASATPRNVQSATRTAFNDHDQ